MLGEEYGKTRDALIELTRYTRALAKRSSTDLLDGEDALEEVLHRPYRFVVIGEVGAGKTSFLERLTGVALTHLEHQSPSVAITRDTGHRVFDEAEDCCEKHYTMRLKPYELVEVHGYSRLDEKQLAGLHYLMDGADFVFWLFPSENPWSASTWDSVERDYSHAAMKSALVLHKSDRRAAEDMPMLLKHMKELSVKRAGLALPMFATNIHASDGMDACHEVVNLTLNRSMDRRRELRNVYKRTYELLRRTEENIDSRSRSLSGDQEYLKSIQAQIERMRAEEVRHVMEGMAGIGDLLASQIQKIDKQTRRRSGVIASHIAIFGRGNTARKVENYMLEVVSAAGEVYVLKQVDKMREQCREKWLEIRPHLENRLSIDVGDFSDVSFDEQEKIFLEGMAKALERAVPQLKLRRFLDVLMLQRYKVLRKLSMLGMLVVTIGSLIGCLSENPLSPIAISIVGVGMLFFASSIYYSVRSAAQMRASFHESLVDAVPALRMELHEGYVDKVSAFYRGYAPMFQNMRKHIADAKTDLEPQQKVAGVLFLRLSSLEHEI